MARWAVQTQQTGITDTMRINILSTLRTSIDTHGSSNFYGICSDVRKWLNATYGGDWGVIIGEVGKFSLGFGVAEEKYLCVKETDLGWTVCIVKVSG